MSRDLPIWILEPEQTETRELTARKLLEGGQKRAYLPEAASLDEVKQQLKRIREDAASNIDQFSRELETNMRLKGEIKLKKAVDNTEAVSYIARISDDIKTISTNNSSIVTRELKPGLIVNGFTVVNSYLNEFDVEERKILDYWDLPHLEEKNLIGSFDVSRKMKIDRAVDVEAKKYMAVLGVNAVSVEDTTIFFLQHFSNIYKDLEEAERIVLVVGLDKLVRSKQDAAFVAKCMGIFGMESVVLAIEPKPSEMPAIDKLLLAPSDREREFHLIILDNGRTKLLQGEFRDLFLCIGCRACNNHCPIRRFFNDVDYIWTPKNYLVQSIEGISSNDTCLHCEACRLECPLDIDLPGLMWKAKIDYISKHSRPFYHKVLGMPEILAKLGTAFASLANWLMGVKLVRIATEFITGIDRRTTLPRFNSQTFREWFKKNG